MMDEFISEVKSELKAKFYKKLTTRDLILRNEGWDDKRLDRLLGLPEKHSAISAEDIRIIGPEYFPYSVLVKHKEYRDYPFTFAVNKVLKTEEQPALSGNYHPRSYGGINYKSKKSEDNIRLLHLDEIFIGASRSKLLSMLGERNDHTYTELEIMGMIGLLDVISPPDRFISEVWGEVKYANNGVTLRKRLKCWGLSIKRWPDYWTQRYNCDISKIIETDTVLGYMIEDTIQPYHFELIDELLADKNIYYDKDFDGFVEDVTYAIKEGFQSGSGGPEDINFTDYMNDWNAWTTSGSANEFRMEVLGDVDGENKKLRVNKSALPLVTTVKEILDNNDYSVGALMKAEVGKNRIAYSCPTKGVLIGKYILDKYAFALSNARTTHNYISYTNEQRLQFSLNMVTLKPSIGVVTADIENNDVNQLSLLNTLYMYIAFKDVLQEEDKPLFFELLKQLRYNIVRVNTQQLANSGYQFKAPLIEKKGPFSYFGGYGGLQSGQAMTYDINSLNNYVTDTLASNIVLRLVPGSEKPDTIVGGDDKTGTCSSLRTAALLFLSNTSIYLPVNAEKSYISYSTGEFFRIMYIRGEKRQGYPSRVIHSVISSNPASSQEIDIVTACKAFWSNCAQISRRGGDFHTLKNWLVIYARAKGIPKNVISIPTEHGGCGIPLEPENFAYRVIPGIPRFKMQYRQYVMNLSWFDQIMAQLKVDTIPGARESYMKDMLTGIRDKEARTESRSKYKSKLSNWSDTCVVVYDKPRSKLPGRLVNSLERITHYYNNRSSPDYVLENILEVTSSHKIRSRQYYHVRKDYQLFSDILNRGKYAKFRDKLDVLTELGILFVSDNCVNTKSAYVLQSLLNSNLSLSSPVVFSFPADMTFLYLNIGLSVLGPVTIRTPSDFTWFSDYIRYSVAKGFFPYLHWATSW